MYLIEYALKVSVSLAVVYLFYQLFLRKLTFYYWNRVYLIGYTLLSFVIPFVNIMPVLKSNSMDSSGVVRLIPSIELKVAAEGIVQHPAYSVVPAWDVWDWALFAFLCVTAILFLRFLVRWFSFFRMRRNAQLISEDGMKLYQVDKPIIPFSFGNSIFINARLHNKAELQEIIRHEFVHVKQKHTHDIICSEFLCILNWYNPFAWMIRKAIRQNLEFIADHKVLENGFDKKQYQYMLLKVIGNDHFSIANQFNFSSLKKRITMMNKMKSDPVQLWKFLFILPLMAVTLLSFRNEKKTFQQQPDNRPATSGYHFTDTIPIDLVTTKGYFVHKTMENGEMVVIVEDKKGKRVEKVSMAKWDADEDHYSNLYGYPLPPPPPPPPPAPPSTPDAPRMPKDVIKIEVNNKKATVLLKNGEEEKYDLSNATDNATFQKKYGKTITTPPVPPAPPALPAGSHGANTTITVSPDAPVIAASPGTTIYASGDNVTGVTRSVTASGISSPVPSRDVTIASSPSPARVSVREGRGTGQSISVDGVSPAIAPMTLTAVGGPVSPEPVIYGETILELKIYKFTTREKLDKLIQQAKDKGVELEFDKIEYNSKKEITHISGTIKKENSKSTFSMTDFETLNLLVTKKGDKYSCLIYMNNQKEEI